MKGEWPVSESATSILREFVLPDVGEGLRDAEVVEWRVAQGDVVAESQIVVEVETAKSSVELPSPYAGVVAEILVQQGEMASVGSPLFRVRTEASEAATAVEESKESAISDDPAERMLVGRRPRVRAKPPVRRLARAAGVDLSAVPPTGNSGEVTREDLRRFLDGTESGVDSPRRVPVRGVRRETARAMVSSAFTAPHVTVFLDVDATRTMEYVRRLREDPAVAEHRPSPLVVVIRAMVRAAQRSPFANSRFDGDEILVFPQVNVGVAVATDRGLLVPVLHHAERMGIAETARAVRSAALRAREGALAQEDQHGGTISVTNIGVFGVDAGTPILPPGQTSIVALGAVRDRPWVVDGEVQVRKVATIAGSFDHRAVDGDTASRFLADVGAVLEEPALLLE